MKLIPGTVCRKLRLGSATIRARVPRHTQTMDTNTAAFCAAAISVSIGVAAFSLLWFGRRQTHQKGVAGHGFPALVGNTALIEITSLSKATGCRILAKVEFSNPGGCQKDRVAKRIVEEAEAAGLLGGSNQTIVEGTSGSTGISLSLMARARGYKVCVWIV